MKANERRLNLLLLLQSNQNWNVDQLAEHFGVSRRTIFRDMNTLSEINVPVTWDKDSGYGLMKGYTIPPIMFTPKEISTIMVGLSFVKTQIDNTLVEDANKVMVKIKNILPNDELKHFMDSIGSKTIIDPFKRFGTEKRKGGDWFTIGNAISKNYKLSFLYTSEVRTKPEKRIVNPYLLVYYTDHWTLIGYCNSRKDIRSFRLERMKEIEILPESFSAEKIPSEKKLLFRTSEKGRAIKIHVDQSAVKQFKASVPAKILSSDVDESGITYTFEFENLNYLNEWLFTFHDNIKVIEPEDLKKKRILKIQSMLKGISGS
jgi:predicted DNA-binding transcriptional regulator YafY